jgi:hypothetical protein
MEEQGQGNNCFRRKVGKRGAATSADELRDIKERRAAGGIFDPGKDRQRVGLMRHTVHIDRKAAKETEPMVVK